MSDANYKCPQCSGELVGEGTDYTCKQCNLNVTEVLEHLERNDGPLANIARQLREALAE